MLCVYGLVNAALHTVACSCCSLRTLQD